MIKWFCKTCNDWMNIDDIFYDERHIYNNGEVIFFQCIMCGELICKFYDKLEKLVEEDIATKENY